MEWGGKEGEETQKSFTLVNGVEPTCESRMARIFYVGWGLFPKPLAPRGNNL